MLGLSTKFLIVLIILMIFAGGFFLVSRFSLAPALRNEDQQIQDVFPPAITETAEQNLNQLEGLWKKESSQQPSLIEFKKGQICTSWSGINANTFKCLEYSFYFAKGNILFINEYAWMEWKISGDKLELKPAYQDGTIEIYVKLSTKKSESAESTKKIASTSIIKKYLNTQYNFEITYNTSFLNSFENTFTIETTPSQWLCDEELKGGGIYQAESYYRDPYKNCTPLVKPFSEYISEYYKDRGTNQEKSFFKTASGADAVIIHYQIPNTNVDTGEVTPFDVYYIVVDLPVDKVESIRTMNFYYNDGLKCCPRGTDPIVALKQIFYTFKNL